MSTVFRRASVYSWVILAMFAATASAQKPIPTKSPQAQFQNFSSCPSTGKRDGNCPGYRIGYKIGLCAGGQDRWTNMVWLTESAYREQQRREAAACTQHQAPQR